MYERSRLIRGTQEIRTALGAKRHCPASEDGWVLALPKSKGAPSGRSLPKLADSAAAPSFFRKNAPKT
jgi:hypothetical protein